MLTRDDKDNQSFFETVTGWARRILLANAEGDITVQNPLPSDGDSVYVKDLDLLRCDNYNFSGSITDYFDSLITLNADITTNNPKQIKLWFKRTIYSHAIGFGCDDLLSGFGDSITIKLLGSGEDVRFEKTYDAISGNSFLAEFGPKVFNGILIEFNTANEVCLSNLTIAKSAEVSSTLHGVDEDGDVQNVTVTRDGNLSISDNSSGLSIAKGDVNGSTFVHKFGNAPNFDTADGGIQGVTVWDGANSDDIDEMVYTYSTTAIIDSVSSTSIADTQELEIQGLDGDYNIIIQNVTLTGQTRVALTTNLLRVFRIKNIGSVDIAGFMYCYENTALSSGRPIDTTKIRALINNGNNQTEMGIYTVPAGKTAYMRSWFASSAGAKKTSNYVMRLRARKLGEVFQLKHRAAITDGGHIQHQYVEPQMFIEKTDIEMTVKITAVSITNAAVAAGFDIVLVDN